MPLSLREKLQKASQANLASNAAKTVGKLTVMEQPATNQGTAGATQDEPTQSTLHKTTQPSPQLPSHEPSQKPTDQPFHQSSQQPENPPTDRTTGPRNALEAHQPPQAPAYPPTVLEAYPEGHPSAIPQDHPQNDRGLDSALWAMLTASQRRVLNYLTRHPGEIVRYAAIAAATDLPAGTVQTIFKRFKALGLLRSRYGSRGVIKGMRFSLDRKIYAAAPHADPLDAPKDNPPTNQASHPATQPPIQNTHRVVIDTEKNLSVSLSVLETTWPALAQTGFGLEQLARIVDNLVALGKPVDRLLQGLDHIEFALTHGRLVDKDGHPVADPCSWAFRALAQNGYYRRPKGFVSFEEQALRDAEAEAKSLAAARQRAETARFEAWKAGLSPEELEKYLHGHPNDPADGWLRRVWKDGGGR